MAISLTSFFPRAEVLGVVALPALVFLVFIRLRKWISQRAIVQEHHCLEPTVENPGFGFGVRKGLELVRNYRGSRLLPYTMDLFRKLGHTYVTRMFLMDVVFTCEPENIKHILQRRFEDFDVEPLRHGLFVPVAVQGISAIDGQPWKDARKLFRTHFADTKSVADIDGLEHHVQALIARIPKDGRTVDMQVLFTDLLMDVLTSVAVGQPLGILSPHPSQTAQEVNEACLNIKDWIARCGLAMPLAWVPKRIRAWKAGKRLQDYSAEFVQREKASFLIKQKSEKPDAEGLSFVQRGVLAGGKFSQTFIRDQATMVYLAGVDTTAGLLAVTFFHLARDPALWNELRDSVHDMFGETAPRYDQLTTLPLLRHCFDEALRVIPEVPFNAKVANKDTWLPRGGGPDGLSSILIRKGQIVSFWSWASHRNSDVFGDDVETFRPSRWDNLSVDAPGYIPFQPGQRVCPGQRIAFAIASFVVIRLLQTFHTLESRDSRPFTESLGINLASKHGVLVALTE